MQNKQKNTIGFRTFQNFEPFVQGGTLPVKSRVIAWFIGVKKTKLPVCKATCRDYNSIYIHL